MAFTAEMPTPAYIIYRDTSPGQPMDPAAPPVFFPAKDSDELFDALRVKYPFTKTHSERMRDAIIEFLLEERQTEQLQATPAMPFTDTAATSPWQQTQSWPSMSSTGSISTFSSPETLGLATPSFGMSPHPQMAQSSRNNSTVALTTTGTSPTSSITPPALENMTGVFSVSSSGQPKQRMRRKMTEAEKVEYRKRRIVKACEKCQRRKRKCNHNQGDLESLTSKMSKVTKSHQAVGKVKSTPQTVAPVSMESNAAVDFEGLNFDDSFGMDMQLFDDIDFESFLENPLPDYGFGRVEGQSTGLASATGYGFDQHENRNQPLLGQTPATGYGFDQHEHRNKPVLGLTYEPGYGFDQHENRNKPVLGPDTPTTLLPHNERHTTAVELPQRQLRWDDSRDYDSILQEGEQPHRDSVVGGAFRNTTAGRNLQCDTSINRTNAYEALKFDQLLHGRGVDKKGKGLLSTSVAGSRGGLFALEGCSVARKGRPTPTPQGEGAPIPTPLFDSRSIDRATSPLVELFMLKRRIPKALHSIVAGNRPRANLLVLQTDQLRTGVSSSKALLLQGQTSETKADAYMQDSYTHSGSATAGSRVVSFGSSIATTASGGCDQHFASPAASFSCERAGARPSRGGMGDDTETALTTGAHADALQAINSQTSALEIVRPDRGTAEATEYRLSDHFRRRDHFGRCVQSSWWHEGHEVASAVFVLSGLLLLIGLLPPGTSSFALLSLALTRPVPGAKGCLARERAWRFWSMVWGTMLECTIKNSSWLAALRMGFAEEKSGTVSLPQGSWHDGIWPGTSGEGEGTRRRGWCGGGDLWRGR